jgi:hypothetical protein
MKKNYFLLILALPFLALLAMQWQQLSQFHTAVTTPDGFLPRPGDPIDLRSNRVAILRQITASPYEGIELFDDRRAFRFYYPQGPGHPFTQRVLSIADYQQFKQLQSAWCQSVPSFRPPRSEERTYEIGMRCSIVQTLQVSVPEEELPPFFIHLRQNLPAPPQ